MTWRQIVEKLTRRSVPAIPVMVLYVHNPYALKSIADYERDGFRQMGLVYDRVQDDGSHEWAFVSVSDPIKFLNQSDFDEALSATIGRLARSTGRVDLGGDEIKADKNLDKNIANKLKAQRRKVF